MTFWRGLNTLPSLHILLLLRRSQIDTVGVDLNFTRLPFTNLSQATIDSCLLGL